MRVIAGSARRLKLVTLDGLDTRPTGDKIKETLFNMLQFDLPGSSFLDLFSGSGGIAIEALSRGASEAVLVDNSRKACAVIRENLETTHFTREGELMLCDAMTAIRRLEDQGRRFDYIFLDPPYRKGLERTVLERLASSTLPADGGLIIVEAALETDFDYLPGLGYTVDREKLYKTSKHIFIRKQSAASGSAGES